MTVDWKQQEHEIGGTEEGQRTHGLESVREGRIDHRCKANGGRAEEFETPSSRLDRPETRPQTTRQKPVQDLLSSKKVAG